MIEVRNPANQFFDRDGSPLDDGYLYIGTTGSNPETSPQAVYWDKDGTIPAAQPIRTINGYPARTGSPSKFYTATKNYSITVKDKRGILVISLLNSDSGIFDELTDSAGASGIGYDNATSGLVADDVQAAIDELKAEANAIEALAQANAAAPPFGNLFANAAFLINQRVYVSGTATAAPNQYTLDRIRVNTAGQSLSFSAIGGGVLGNYIVAPVGGAAQVIEGSRITGGFYSCNWLGTGTIEVDGVSRVKGEQFELTAGANCVVTMYGQIGTMAIVRPELQGSISLNRFEYDFFNDLALCRRYYESGEFNEFSGNVTSGNAYYSRVTFSIRKRSSPTVALNPSGTPSGFAAVAGAVSNITNAGFTEGRTATGTGVGRFYSQWVAESEL
jgi:hypothetical protein